MKRHPLLLLAAAAAMIAVGAWSTHKKPTLLLLDWASHSRAETPPVAILIEMGLQDELPTPWPGRAQVTGAQVVSREGYRFRDGDHLVEPDSWQARTRRPIRLPPRNPAVARQEGATTVGVVLHLAELHDDASLTLERGDKGAERTVIPLKEVLAGKPRLLWGGGARVRRISTATPLVTAKTEDDFPAAAYGPDGTLWLAYISYTVRHEDRRVQQAQLPEQPADFKSFYMPEFADQLFVKYYRDGRWSEPLALTGPHEDLVRCAVAVESNGDAWVAYSANRQGRYDIFVRPISPRFSPEAVAHPAPRPGPEHKLTDNTAASLNPVMTTDQSGGVVLSCQCRADGGPVTVHFTCRNGQWSSGKPVSVNGWYPAVAAGPDGQVARAVDLYQDGDYDVHVSVADKADSDPGPPLPVAASARFEARPSACYDVKGRLWIAYEEGPVLWGKDYGALDALDGNPLYNARSVRVVCLQDGKLFRPTAELPTSVSKQHAPNEQNKRYAYPRLGLDGKGRLWLVYRQKFGTRNSTHAGSYWLSFARRLDGDHWTEPMELHHSDGFLDHRPVLLPHPSGGLLVIHNTDGRYSHPQTLDDQIYASVVDLPGDPVEPELVPAEPGYKDATREQEERAAVRRIRDYRIEHGGHPLQLLRGDFHRHTEISWDGGPDGTLEDFFRYGMDVAFLDWIANTDHDNGDGREYTWWLTQKLTEAYHVPGLFTPMFAYERSVRYPHGHRNCMFPRRGVRTLPRLAEHDPEHAVAGIHAEDTQMLYRYLKELGGLCASHTSATDMGTDWRDNNPAVEPIVEVYQGDRMSYEYEGAPRSGHDPKSKKPPANLGGWEPAGFIDRAFRKGYRFGFQSSSDHWSTHISFCIVMAERPEREAIVAALKQRHCYAATDDIIVDVRSGSHLMGDEFRATDPPALQIHVIGTGPLDRVEILRDSEVVESFQPGRQEYHGTWTDPKPAAGVHYYYVRVLQKGGQMAWGSPMWIDSGE
ncbi:MAG: hypothetical protein JO112_10940 [Planctomycetes bacterium]|nr:hypothetical protein [Planctomycetota bacterium]